MMRRRRLFAALPDAVGRDGKDLSRVHWGFLAAELRAMPQTTDAVQAVIDPVIDGMDLLFSGQQWTAARAAADAADASEAAAFTANAAAAARAAAAAASAATAARAAAFSAASAAFFAKAAAAAAARAAADSVNAATYAASVAKAAEAAGRARLRQRDTLLALIAAA